MFKKFLPPPKIESGQDLRTHGDKYQVYIVETGEVLFEGDYVEVVPPTQV